MLYVKIQELHKRKLKVTQIAQACLSSPAVIGLHDWAMKQGHQYDTRVCDLETKRPIGLFAGSTWICCAKKSSMLKSMIKSPL